MSEQAALPALVRVQRFLYRLAYAGLSAWAFVRRPHGRGAKFLLTHEGELLLVRHTYGPDRWEIPGGAVRRREDPHSAALRELGEELGLEDVELHALGVFEARIANRVATLYCYTAELADRDVVPQLAEIAEVGWFLPAQAGRVLPRYTLPIVRVLLARGAAGTGAR